MQSYDQPDLAAIQNAEHDDDTGFDPEEIPVADKNNPYWVPKGNYWPDGRVIYEALPYWIENLEDAQLYNKGGHHPVHLGDILYGRYEVVHKLGSGGFGLVWLCRDTKAQAWRAVKIMTADFTQKSSAEENKTYEKLRSTNSLSTLEKNNLVIPFRSFLIEGPNGRHNCLVLPLLGGTLDSWRLSLPFGSEDEIKERKDLLREIVKPIQFLHSHGLCHGDIKPANYLMKIRNIDKLSKSQILEMTGEPELLEMKKKWGQAPGDRSPDYVVRASEKSWWQQLATGALALSDFGSSFVVDDLPRITTFTKAFAAPEVFFKDSQLPGYPSDVWSLGCTMLEICTGDQLFSSLNRFTISQAPSDLEVHLGPLPEPFRNAWEDMQLCGFDDDEDVDINDDEETGNYGSDEVLYSDHCTVADIGDLEPTMDEANNAENNETLEPVTWTSSELEEHRNAVTKKSPFKSTIEAVLWRERYSPEVQGTYTRFHYNKGDIKEFASLLKSIFRYDPAERATIDQILQSTYLKKNSKFSTTWEQVKRMAEKTGKSSLMGGANWIPGMSLGVGGPLDFGFQKRIMKPPRAVGSGTRADPQIIWTDGSILPETEELLESTEEIVRQELKNYGLSYAWIAKEGHGTSTFHQSGNGNVYVADDFHITARMGTAANVCNLHGHLYILYEDDNVKKKAIRMMKEHERSIVGGRNPELRFWGPPSYPLRNVQFPQHPLIVKHGSVLDLRRKRIALEKTRKQQAKNRGGQLKGRGRARPGLGTVAE
ncbi:kinase-like domain-containing protein [Xylariaceae sp. FL1019]|nr:kinase-like domain-containing protein [Xylariaceae sp. FL1019]